jgi:threonine/homoserine/homoserine lactone efflux protein
MPETAQLLLFLAAALVVALSPGPGMLYVGARSLAGGRAEGIASSLGTGLGGSLHIVAGAVGVSALVLASAEAFTLLKLAGAGYLMWLGFRTWRQAGREAGAPLLAPEVSAVGARRAFAEGVVVEALNPKTAAFFLAFIPQFVDPSAGSVAVQFVAMGVVSVTLNTGVDVVLAFGAGRVRDTMQARPGMIRRLRQGSGVAMASLGAALLFARRPNG